MKYFVVLFLIAPLAQAQNCSFYSYNDEVVFWGYPINFGQAVAKKYSEQGYTQTTDRGATPHSFKLSIEQVDGRRFKFAKATIETTDSNGRREFSQTKRCWMVNCSVHDAVKIITRAIKKLKLAPCND